MPDESSGPVTPFTKENQDEIAAGVEKGIRDTHAWKDMVRPAATRRHSLLEKLDGLC